MNNGLRSLRLAGIRAIGARPSHLLPALLVAAVCLAPATAADAQVRGYFSSDPNVTVDLSVLGGPGNEPVTSRPLPGGATQDYVRTPDGLLFPPATPPRSRLDGQFATRAVPVLTPPAGMRTPSASAAAPQSRLNVPAPAATSSAPPAPATTAKPMPAPAPAAAPATASSTTTATTTPPPAAPATPAPAQTAARTPTPPPAPVPPVPAVPQASAPSPAPASAAAPEPAAPAASSTTTPTAVETASRSAAPAPDAAQSALPETQVRVLFDGDSSKLPEAAKSELIGLVGKLEANDKLRLQIEAYAAGTADTASQARRLSLSRALAVRSYLIEQGVRSTRMDVRALGNKESDPPAPADRVDARLVER